MMRSPVFVLLVALLIAVQAAQAIPIAAQGDPDGWTLYEMNLRAGPGTSYPALTLLPADTGLVFDARTDDLTWLLARTADGAWRGWVASLYLRYRDGFAAARLPVSGEVIGAAPAPAAAPGEAPPPAGGIDAWTGYVLNLRAGPDTGQAVLAVLPANTGLIAEARSGDSRWLLVHTGDGALRGWAAAAYLRPREGFAAAALPVSGDVITPGAPETAPGAGLPAGVGPLFDFLQSVPVIPAISARAAALVAGGGHNPHRFTKAGDCNSQAWDYLSPFDTGQYTLGEYGSLQAAIDFFRGSFSDESPAARVGFSALTMVDGTWADPNLCDPGETPFWCALRTSGAAIVLLTFGPNDVRNLTPEQFSGSVRKMVYWAIQFGALPVLSTFPWCGSVLADKALAFNAEIVTIARENDVPVINFWKASQGLQNCGYAPDGVHLTTAGPPYGAYFTGDQGLSGHTLRNLVTLQTLDAIRAAVG